jgi:hypothetical protein
MRHMPRQQTTHRQEMVDETPRHTGKHAVVLDKNRGVNLADLGGQSQE